MSECSDIPKSYCLQEKSTDFGLEVSVVYIISSLYVLNSFKYFGAKCLKKINKI